MNGKKGYGWIQMHGYGIECEIRVKGLSLSRYYPLKTLDRYSDSLNSSTNQIDICNIYRQVGVIS